MKFYYETKCKRCGNNITHNFTQSDINPSFEEDNEDMDLEGHFDLFIMLEKNHVIQMECYPCNKNTFQEIVSTTKSEF